MTKKSLLRGSIFLVLVTTLSLCLSYAPIRAMGLDDSGSGETLSAASRSEDEIDQIVCTLISSGDYVDGEAIVCYLGSTADSHEIVGQSDGAASGLLGRVETLSSVTARQYAEATGESIPARAEQGLLTAQSSEEPVEILRVCDSSQSTEQLLRELLRDPRVLSAEPNYLMEIADDDPADEGQ